MNATTEGQERAVAPAADRRELLSINHYHNAEHLANERTHLAYMRTAIAVISLGITMNRFSRYLTETEHIERSGPLDLLRSTSQIGLGNGPFRLLVDGAGAASLPAGRTGNRQWRISIAAAADRVAHGDCAARRRGGDHLDVSWMTCHLGAEAACYV